MTLCSVKGECQAVEGVSPRGRARLEQPGAADVTSGGRDEAGFVNRIADFFGSLPTERARIAVLEKQCADARLLLIVRATASTARMQKSACGAAAARAKRHFAPWMPRFRVTSRTTWHVGTGTVRMTGAQRQ